MSEKFRVIELFGGIGACTKALKRLGVDVEVVDYVEIDKYAVQSYNAINGTNFEPQDITEWHKHFDDIDLIMHGSPCQDFSISGKQAGGDENSGTRSSLMYETIRIVEDIMPKYVLWENVKNLLSDKHIHNYRKYQFKMEALGYNNYSAVLNAKDYGLPQNRERVFTLSIRKDVDGNYTMPTKQTLNKTMGDVLESSVDEKYYLSDKAVAGIRNSKFVQKQKQIQTDDICETLLSRDYKDPKCVIESQSGDLVRFEFPPKEKLRSSLQELLETDVDETYFLSDKGVKYVLKRVGGYVQLIDEDTVIAHCPITAKGNNNWTGNFVKFEFPPKQKLTKRLKDVLETDVDEKYYLPDDYLDPIVDKLVEDTDNQRCNQVGTLSGGVYKNMNDSARRVYSDDGLSPTVHTAQGGNTELKVAVSDDE